MLISHFFGQKGYFRDVLTLNAYIAQKLYVISAGTTNSTSPLKTQYVKTM